MQKVAEQSDEIQDLQNKIRRKKENLDLMKSANTNFYGTQAKVKHSQSKKGFFDGTLFYPTIFLSIFITYYLTSWLL